MSKLVVLSGVPGSGKSTFSNHIKEKKNGHIYVISSDGLRGLITGNPQCLDADKTVWQMFYALANVYSFDKDGIVVLDATNAVNQYRVDVIKPYREMYDEIILVSFDIDKDVVRRQNVERPYPIPCENLEKLLLSFQQPNEVDEAFFDKIYIVKDRNTDPIIDEILK